MRASCASRVLTAVLGFAVASFSSEKTVSVADCQFAANPQEFLSRTARIRQAINDRAVKWNGVADRSARPAAAADTIPQRNFIDQEIFGKLTRLGVPSAPLASDEEFLRRIYLDLTGRIPGSADVRAFLADTSSGKRDAAIDRLLDSPEFIDRWTLWMGDLLQNTSKLVNASINRNAQGRNMFHAYIRDAVSRDKPLRTVAIEVITGKGNNYDEAHGAANFPMAASTAMGPVQDTYDTMLVKSATTFLGVGNYDCLLCHNGRGHLDQVNLWGTGQTRAQAESMAAFFSRLVFSPGQPANSFMVSDASAGAYDLDTDSGNRPSRLPVGSLRSLTPLYRETLAAPNDGDWRAAFAENMTQDPMFARNLANRLWKQMFGLALAEPVDALDPARLDPANAPPAPWDFQATHPELLEKLAGELAKQEFRLRPFLRTVAQSSAYQLSSRFDGEWQGDYVSLFARHYARRMEGEEVHDAIVKTTGMPGGYSIPGWADPVGWAMKLPEPVEPSSDAGARNFMNTFLRGDRDTQERSQAGSIQQQLYLMNDPFVIDRVKVAQSSKLRALTQMAKSEDLIEELYLTFLSRRPSDGEMAAGVAFLAKASSRNDAVEDLAWMCINKVEFLFSY